MPPMTISQIITKLRRAQEEHGDLPCYTAEADIAKMDVTPCVDGVSRTTNGVPEKPTEFYLDFHPGA